jgi:hypothetical protein
VNRTDPFACFAWIALPYLREILACLAVPQVRNAGHMPALPNPEKSKQASLVGTYRAMAYNNAWANRRLLNACRELAVEEFVAVRTGFFPSIAQTLNHILIVDWFCVDGLEGGVARPAGMAQPHAVRNRSGSAA